MKRAALAGLLLLGACAASRGVSAVGEAPPGTSSETQKRSLACDAAYAKALATWKKSHKGSHRSIDRKWDAAGRCTLTLR